MAETKVLTPTEIARETIKKMAIERITPTPENYQQIYNQIANISQSDTLDSAFKKAIKTLPRETIEHKKWIKSWEKVLSEPDFSSLPILLSSVIDTKVSQTRLWPDTIRELLKNWDAKSSGLSNDRKKESLERVLINFGKDADLPDRLQTMMKSWNVYSTAASGNHESASFEFGTPDGQAEELAAKEALVAQIDQIDTEQASEVLSSIQDMTHTLLGVALIPHLDGYPDLKEEAYLILKTLENGQKLTNWPSLITQLKSLCRRMEVVGINEEDMKNDLLNLLKLLIENISELVTDDKWLQGQLAAVQTIISSPLDKQLIKDAEKSLREVIVKQGSIKHSLTEAKHNFKQMITVFVERLTTMANSTGEYQDKVEVYSEQLENTDDIEQISKIVDDLMKDTRLMQADIVRSREDLLSQQVHAAEAENKIRQLERELNELSDRVRVDQLTGVLNRKGLDDAFSVEISRAQRGDIDLCVVMLDIDNFKQMNDTYGHEAGDKTLQHLVNVVKESVRAVDVVARFGGEEFVILLPNTSLDQGVQSVMRLQRELTKKFFMHDNKRLLVTFSAGVSLYKVGEVQADVLQRADKAMYLAKQNGKNRVFSELDLLLPQYSNLN